MNHIDTMKLALEALEVATTPLAKDRQEVLRAQAALREALAEQSAQQCKWPICQSEEYQQVLAEQIKRELVGEQPAQQEPYGWHTEDHLTDRSATTYSKDVADRWKSKGWPVTPLYTPPQEQPSKPWVGLTPEQRATIAEANNMLVDDDLFDAIEAKLREKNT